MHSIKDKQRFDIKESQKLLIDGKWVEAASGKTFETRNPSNNQVISQIALGEAEDIDKAVAAAKRALEGPWSTVTPYGRQMILLRFADLVEKNFEEFAALDSLEMGTPIQRTLANRARILGMIRYYAGQATCLEGATIPNSLPGNVMSCTIKEPIGVVGAIIPWNAPMAATVWKVGPVLATGCTMILKPAEDASLTPLRMGELLIEAGVPDGVVNIVTGTGERAGARLVEHPDVKKIAFTGSHITGQNIMRSAAVNVKRISLELGGKSPNIVFADADLDVAVPAAAMAVFANSGQICIAGSRLFVEAPIYDEFLERLQKYVATLKVGDSADPATDLGPLVSKEQLERVQGYLTRGVAQGGRLICGGTPLDSGTYKDGNFFAPAIFADVADTMEIACEEIFGPVIAVMPFSTEEEVVERANDTQFGLACGIWTNDVKRAWRMTRAIKSGVVWVNTYHLFDPAVPFGGYKMSGYGREGGAEHLHEYLNTKSVWMAG